MSKELEALKDLREDAKHHLDHHIKYLNERLDIIETALKENKELKERIILNKASFEMGKKQYEKQLKALEIIKSLPQEEKQILLNAIYTYTKSEKKYNLLKGVLLWKETLLILKANY